jgi:integrase
MGWKHRRRELPEPAASAIERSLAHCGKSLRGIGPVESLWQAAAQLEGVSQTVAYARFRRYLVMAGFDPSGFHILRHSAAKLRREAGDSLESISSFLDHSLLAVTSSNSVGSRSLRTRAGPKWQPQSNSDTGQLGADHARTSVGGSHEPLVVFAVARAV